MPSRPARPCRVSSCANLVKGEIAYCPKHIHLAPTGWVSKKHHERQKVYHTARWRKTSMLFRQEHPLCKTCEANGLVRAAQLVDHIIPISQGGDIYDWNNLQSLCTSCHQIKTGKENAEYKTRSTL